MNFKLRLYAERPRWGPKLVCAPSLLVGCFAVHSQQVIVPPTEVGQPARTPEEAAKPVGSISAPAVRRPPGESTPLHWGPVLFNPKLSYHVVHGTGIVGAGTDDDKTTVHTVTPGLVMQFGKFWAADLGVSYNHYTDGDLDDNTGYTFGLSGDIPLNSKWALSLGYSSGFTDQPELETGTQSAELSHNLNLGAVYTVNDRYSMDMGIGVSTRNTEEFSDYLEFTTAEWLNYHWTDRTTFGVGLAGGYNYVDPGADSIYLRPQGRVIWRPGPRLTAQLTAGVQMQYFKNPALELPPGRGEDIPENEWSVFPVFTGALDYWVTDALSFNFGAGHEVENSVLTDLFKETTHFSAGARQRLLKYVYLTANVGYQFNKYQETISALPGGRDDEYFTAYAGLSTQLFRKVQASIFYQFSDNSSSEDEFGFSSNQVGLQLNYQY